MSETTGIDWLKEVDDEIASKLSVVEICEWAAKIALSRHASGVTEGEIRLLESLMPTWAKESEPGLCPTMYGTLSHEDDVEAKKSIDAIFAKLRSMTDNPFSQHGQSDE